MDTVRRPTRRIAIAAVVLAVAAGLTGCTNAVAMSPAPSANAAACADVQVRLPAAVDTKFDLRNTNAQSTAAWGDPAVVLRCGVPKPDALTRTSACFEVDGVGWLATQDGREVSGDAPVEGALTFTTIGRATYVEVEVPAMDDCCDSTCCDPGCC